MFYDECMDTFVSSLNPGESGLPTLADIAAHERVNYTLGFLAAHLAKHTYHIKNYLISKFQFFGKIIPVIKCGQVILVLAALRVLRAMIGLQNGGNEFYNRQMVKYGVFKPIVEELQRVGPHNSLLQSCILEMFEHIRDKKIKSLLTHVVETHKDALSQMPWACTPKQLVETYERMQDSMHHYGSGGPAGMAAAAADDEEEGGGAAKLHTRGSLSNRFRRDTTMDEKQENYFSESADDDEDEVGPAVPLLFGMAALKSGTSSSSSSNSNNSGSSSGSSSGGSSGSGAGGGNSSGSGGGGGGGSGGGGGGGAGGTAAAPPPQVSSGDGDDGDSCEPPTFRKRRMLVDYGSDDDEDDFTAGVKQKSGSSGDGSSGGLAKRQKFPGSISTNTISFKSKFTLATAAKGNADGNGAT